MGQGCRPGRTRVLSHPFHAKIIIESSLQTVKETIGVGVNEKAALSSDKNCPFVYINFDFTLVNKVASLQPIAMGIQSLLFSLSLSYRMFW